MGKGRPLNQLIMDVYERGRKEWVPHLRVAHGGMTYTRALLLNSEVKELKRRAGEVA